MAYPEHVVSPSCGRIASWLEDAVNFSRGIEDGTAVAADLTRSILGLTLRLLDLPVQGGGEPLVRCRQMIHEELGNPELSVASLARRLGCNADYLSHLFRKVTGQRLTAHIEDLRLLKAAELLTPTGLVMQRGGVGVGLLQPELLQPVLSPTLGSISGGVPF